MTSMETGFPLLFLQEGKLTVGCCLFMVLLRLARVHALSIVLWRAVKPLDLTLLPGQPLSWRLMSAQGWKTSFVWHGNYGCSLFLSFLSKSPGGLGFDTWVTFWPQMRKQNSGFNHSCKALLVYQLNFIYWRCCLSGKKQKKSKPKSTPFSSSPTIFMYSLGSGCFGYSWV